MREFQNNPELNSDGQVKRYVHQPLTIDHYGIHAKIQENGRVVITGIPDKAGEYDEVEIPASLVFKLASALKMTREVKFVKVAPGEIKTEEEKV